MTLLSVVFYTVGFIVSAYFVIGVLLLATVAKVYVSQGAPISAKIATVWNMAWIMPKHILFFGTRPMVVICPENPSSEETARIEAWSAQNCGCSKCRARRGE